MPDMAKVAPEVRAAAGEVTDAIATAAHATADAVTRMRTFGRRAMPMQRPTDTACDRATLITLFVAFFLLSLCTFVVPWWYIPPSISTVEYSYIMNGNCGGVAGLSSLSTVSNVSRKCVEVYLLNEADDGFRDFLEVYIGTLLFFCYTLHQITDTYFINEQKRVFGQLMFCVSITTEVCILIWASYQKYERRTAVQQSLVANPHAIMGEFSMYYDVQDWLFWTSMAGRGLCWAVFLIFFVCDVLRQGLESLGRCRVYTGTAQHAFSMQE